MSEITNIAIACNITAHTRTYVPTLYISLSLSLSLSLSHTHTYTHTHTHTPSLSHTHARAHTHTYMSRNIYLWLEPENKRLNNTKIY